MRIFKTTFLITSFLKVHFFKIKTFTMKKNLISLSFLFLIMFIFLHEKITAQTNWKLVGNNLNGTEKLGSLNNFDLRIFTDNIQRMTVKGTSGNGRVGIFTTSPTAKLHINTDAGEDGL